MTWKLGSVYYKISVHVETVVRIPRFTQLKLSRLHFNFLPLCPLGAPLGKICLQRSKEPLAVRMHPPGLHACMHILTHRGVCLVLVLSAENECTVGPVCDISIYSAPPPLCTYITPTGQLNIGPACNMGDGRRQMRQLGCFYSS